MDTNRIYLELLRAGLWDRPACVSGHAGIKDLLGLAARQNTLPTVCHAILDLSSAKPSDKVKEMLEHPLEQCAKAHRSANSTIAAVSGTLADQGILSMVLKGQGIASYYPTPEIRQPGDIDLYVKEEDFEKACGILSAIFGDKTGEVEGKHVSFHVGGSLVLELHRVTHTLRPRRIDRIYQHISDEGTWAAPVTLDIGGAGVLTPNDDFNAFYIFHHLWCHTSTMGIGMRQLCDWAAFLNAKKGSLDCDRIAGWLRQMGLTDVWQVFGCTAVCGLDLDPEAVPLYDASKMKRGELLLAYFMDQGDNREYKHGRKDQSTAKHKAGSLGYIHKRLVRMFPIFPGQAVSHYFTDLAGGVRKLFKRR